jgi:general secretion pathway protein C
MATRATTPREWGIALIAGLGLSVLLVTLWRGPDAQAPASAPADPAPVAPSVITAIPGPIIAAPAAAPAPATGYHLRGLIARPGTTATAIVEDGDGRQRLVRIGSQLGPGLAISMIDASGLTLTSADGDARLDFGDQRHPEAAMPATVTPETAGVATLASLAASISDYRTGLDPRPIAGITRGFTLVDASRLPLFRKAGLQTGDIITMINGSAIDSEEKVMELPAEINGAKAVEILYERAGKRETAHVLIAR